MPLPRWTPELDSLDLLLSVAELGSVGRAASAHRISQPSASTRLARLERQLGVTLLVRSTRGSTLTPAGEATATWAREVIGAARTLTDGVRALRTDQHARLRVCGSLTIAEYLLPSWLLSLRRHHANVDVAVTVENSQEVCEHVRAGAADLGFIEMPTPPAGLSTQTVGTDRLALVVAAGYPLAARAAGGVAAHELTDQPLLLREPGSGTRDTFLHALRDALGGLPDLPHATELGSTTTIVATARAGGGIGVISARAVAAEVNGGQLVELSCPELTLQRPLQAVWQGRRPSELAGELVTIAAAGPHGH